MKLPAVFYFLLVTILLGACASTGASLGPSFTERKTGERRQYVKVTFVNNHAFAPSTTTTIMLECSYLRDHLNLEEKTDEEILNDSQCWPADVGNHDAGVGILPGVGSSIVQSAGIVGSAYLIGKGLGDSGDRTTLTDESRTSNNLRQVNNANPEFEMNNDIQVNENVGSSSSSVGSQ